MIENAYIINNINLRCSIILAIYMSIKKILKIGDEFLNKPGENVEFFDHVLLKYINDMIETMRFYDGVGLAANQIGLNQRIILVEVNHNPRYPDKSPIPLMILINPIIEKVGHIMETDIEGCLSVPDVRAEVARFKTIKYQANDELGNLISGIASGFLARIIQHEVDHLDGILFPQRITNT